MKNLKRILALMLSVTLAVSIVPISAGAAEDSKYKADMKTYAQIFNNKMDQYQGKTVILHSNDVHGQIDGYAYIAELEDDFEDAGAEVITMDAGDFSQGDPCVSYSKGANAITLMNAAGYEFSTLGNHEFDYGWSSLKKNLKKAKFKVLCADVTNKKNGKTIYEAHTVYKTDGGVKIGIFGMETPETQSKANPSLIKGLSFKNNTSGKTELFDCGKKEVKSLKKEGADIIISLSHLGMDEESKADKHRSLDLYNNVSGIDFIIDGHSHDVMTEGPDGEPIQSSGTKFDNIGVIVIDDASKKITEHYLVDTEGLEKDPKVEKKAQKIISDIDAEYGAAFAKTRVKFTGEKTDNRCYETNTGDLITDAMVWKVKNDKIKLKVPEENVIAILNGGTIRAGLEVGKISKKDINAILPFGNTLCVAYVSGSKLLEILEASTFCTPETLGGYPQTCGIKFTVDTSKEYDQGSAYPNSTYYKPDSIKRVKIESVNGKKFKKTAKYAIVTTDYNTAGGDTYYVLKKANSFDTGIALDEVVIDYISKELKGDITKKKYGKTRGDVTIIKADEETVK